MTENTQPETRKATNMKAVDHTHPDTGRPFGERVVYQRGPTVAADGGARPSEDDRDDRETVPEEEDDEADGTRMRDVDHEAPDEDGANRVFERGNEGRDDTK